MKIKPKQKENLIKRHAELKSMRKISRAIEVAGVSRETYYRLINGDEKLTPESINTISDAQREVIEDVKRGIRA